MDRQAAEIGALGIELLDDGELVTDRTTTRGSPGDFAQQPRQHGTAAVGAGGVLLVDGDTAGVVQLVEPRIGSCSSVEARA